MRFAILLTGIQKLHLEEHSGPSLAKLAIQDADEQIEKWLDSDRTDDVVGLCCSTGQLQIRLHINAVIPDLQGSLGQYQ